MAQSNFTVISHILKVLDDVPCPAIRVLRAERILLGVISSCLDQILLKVNVFFPIRDSVPWQKQNLIPASLMGQISHLFVKATGLCSEDLAGRRIALILIKLWRRKEKKMNNLVLFLLVSLHLLSLVYSRLCLKFTCQHLISNLF